MRFSRFVFLHTTHFLPRNVRSSSFFRLNINYFFFSLKEECFILMLAQLLFAFFFVCILNCFLFSFFQLNMSFLFLLRWFVYIFLDFFAVNLTLTCFSTTKAYWFVMITLQMFAIVAFVSCVYLCQCCHLFSKGCFKAASHKEKKNEWDGAEAQGILTTKSVHQERSEGSRKSMTVTNAPLHG